MISHIIKLNDWLKWLANDFIELNSYVNDEQNYELNN